MKIYLAAPWGYRFDAAMFGEMLVKAGHTLTEPWWNHREVGGYPGPPNGAQQIELTEQADKDWDGVEACDVMVVLQLGLSEGKAVEQGLALAYDKPIIVVSPEDKRGHIFHYMTDHFTFVRTIGEAIDELSRRASHGNITKV